MSFTSSVHGFNLALHVSCTDLIPLITARDANLHNDVII